MYVEADLVLLGVVHMICAHCSNLFKEIITICKGYIILNNIRYM